MRVDRRWLLPPVAALLLALIASVLPLHAAEAAHAAESAFPVPLNDSIGLALQQAASRGEAVRLPAGQYRLTQPLHLPPRSTLTLAPGAVLRGSIPGQALVRMSAGSTLSGGAVVNSAAKDCLGVDVLPGAKDVRITGVRFAGPRANAISLNQPGLQRVRISGNRFDGVAYGVLLNPGATRAEDLAITGNVFTRIGADAIEINAAVRRLADRARDVTITRNRIERMSGAGDSSGFGVGLAGVVDFRVAWNRFSGVRNEAVHLEDRAARGVIAANVVQDGGSGDRPAVAIYRTVDDVEVRRNVIRRFRGSGIAVLWDSRGSSTRIRITRNVVQDVSRDAVVVGGDRGTGPFTVRGNLLRDVAGDGIAVLGSHGRSTVRDNTIVRIGGARVAVRLAGRGARSIRDSGPRRTAAQVLGTAVAAAADR